MHYFPVLAPPPPPSFAEGTTASSYYSRSVQGTALHRLGLRCQKGNPDLLPLGDHILLGQASFLLAHPLHELPHDSSMVTQALTVHQRPLFRGFVLFEHDVRLLFGKGWLDQAEALRLLPGVGLVQASRLLAVLGFSFGLCFGLRFGFGLHLSFVLFLRLPQAFHRRASG